VASTETKLLALVQNSRPAPVRRDALSEGRQKPVVSNKDLRRHFVRQDLRILWIARIKLFREPARKPGRAVRGLAASCPARDAHSRGLTFPAITSVQSTDQLYGCRYFCLTCYRLYDARNTIRFRPSCSGESNVISPTRRLMSPAASEVLVRDPTDRSGSAFKHSNCEPRNRNWVEIARLCIGRNNP
jgi:hypothetical protein